MYTKSLREFLDLLENENELVHVKKWVDPTHEVAALIKNIQESMNKAVIFEKVKGYTIPIVSNILGSPRRGALSLNISVDTLLEQWSLRESKTHPPKIVKTGPCKEVILSDPDVNLTKLPLVTHHLDDAGPYITAGVVFVKDPDWGTNTSFHRMQLVDRNKLRIRMVPGFHLHTYYTKMEEEGKPLEIAVCIGNHPHIMWAGVGKLLLGEDHLYHAGALREAPIEVVKGETVDIHVPTETEIVIEGEILPAIREAEGPFGDYQGYYIPVRENHVLKVKCITHQKNPIYQTILAGSIEDRFIIPGLPVSVQVYKAIKRVVPSIIDVTCWPWVFLCIVKINKMNDEQIRQALLAGLGANIHFIKFLIIVDEDIDIHNINEVIWAMTTRSRPDKTIIIPEVPARHPDPYKIHHGKIGIDATLPIESRERYQRTRIAELERSLEEYFEE